MSKVPTNFKKIAAAFEEVSRRQGPCDNESSGSEYSPEIDSGTDLSHLVNSFIERGDHWVGSMCFHMGYDHENYVDIRKAAGNYEEEEEWDHRGGGLGDGEEEGRNREVLMRLLDGDVEEDDSRGALVRKRLKEEVEIAWQIVGDGAGGDGGGFKRRLKDYLKDRGYDAGPCKSRWGKNNRYLGGEFEYIDINISNTTRYILEPNISNQFQVARPTPHYVALLDTLPRIFIAKPDTFKRVIKLMSHALKESLKSTNMPVPPWRKSGYMMAKWFAKYRRTMNAVSNKIKEDDGNGSGEGSSMPARSRGFGFKAPDFVLGYHICRHDFAPGFRAGLLGDAEGNVVNSFIRVGV